MRRTFHLQTFLVAAVGALGIALAISVTPASADTVRAKRTAKVYAEKGEQSRPVTQVRAGKQLTVLRKEGRWVKVRVNGRTGWITRSNLEVPDERTEAPEGREVSFVEGRDREQPSEAGPGDRVGGDVTTVNKDEGFIDAPEGKKPEKTRERERVAVARERDRERERTEVIEEDPEPRRPPPTRKVDKVKKSKGDQQVAVVAVSETDLYTKPTDDAESLEVAARGDTLNIIDKEGRWYLVENKDGNQGWVRASEVDITGGRARAERKDDGEDDGDKEEEKPEEDTGDPTEAYQYEKFAIRTNAGLGVVTLGQTFRSSSAQPLGNYSVSGNSFAAAVGAEGVYVFSEKLLFGGDVGFLFSRAFPGISFQDPQTGQKQDIAYSTLNVDIGGRVGYKTPFSNGMAIYGRLGIFYNRMDVAGSSGMNLNAARLPSEVLIGPRLGALVDFPRILSTGVLSKISARAHIDLAPSFLGTSLSQTKGLEDGLGPSTTAFFLGMRGDYHLNQDFTVQLTYDLAYQSTEWSGVAATSLRGHMATDAKRSDIHHQILVGVGYAF